jgi:ubiquinone/menaquinone biosynthesis C-methylase UbiE
MNLIEKILGEIDGGSVLDVATQEGHFVQILMKYLKSYNEIVGVDINKDAIETAQNNLDQADVRFLVMDAVQLDFADSYFDTVTISASLHHLANIPGVLGEMKRVLKPGGHFILVEMHRDGKTAAELTSIYLHHWVAKVDTAFGHQHNPTLAIQEFEDYIKPLGLSKISYYQEIDADSDPMEETRIKQLDDLIVKKLHRADRAANSIMLKEQGEQLRGRLHKFGAQKEPIILIVGKK